MPYIKIEMLIKMQFVTNFISGILVYVLYYVSNVGKICDKPLLQNVTMFPDRVFSGNGSSNYEDARFSNSGWCASGSRHKYLSIDLQREYHLTRVVTMGDKNQTKWSRSYSLKFSHDNTLMDASSDVQVFLWF